MSLSADALAMAQLNAAGVTIAQVKCTGLSSGGGFQPNIPKVSPNGSLSEASFESVAAQFGATKTQADQDFSYIDASGDGSITNGEFLKAMGASGNGSTASQELLSLMDTDGNGSVSGTEFLNFESAAVLAEQV